jgi:hypothetical protein
VFDKILAARDIIEEVFAKNRDEMFREIRERIHREVDLGIEVWPWTHRGESTYSVVSGPLITKFPKCDISIHISKEVGCLAELRWKPSR